MEDYEEDEETYLDTYWQNDDEKEAGEAEDLFFQKLHERSTQKKERELSPPDLSVNVRFPGSGHVIEIKMMLEPHLLIKKEQHKFYRFSRSKDDVKIAMDTMVPAFPKQSFEGRHRRASLRDQVQAYCESTDVGNESGAGAGMQASSMESKALHQQDFASPAAMTKKLLEDVSNRVEDNKARQDTLRLQGELFNGYCLGPGRKENRQVVKKLKVHALAQQQRLAQMSTEVIHHYRILDFMCGTTFLLQSYWGELIAIGSRKVGAIPADPRLPRDKVAHKPVTEASVTDEQEAQMLLMQAQWLLPDFRYSLERIEQAINESESGDELLDRLEIDRQQLSDSDMQLCDRIGTFATVQESKAGLDRQNKNGTTVFVRVADVKEATRALEKIAEKTAEFNKKHGPGKHVAAARCFLLDCLRATFTAAEPAVLVLVTVLLSLTFGAENFLRLKNLFTAKNTELEEIESHTNLLRILKKRSKRLWSLQAKLSAMLSSSALTDGADGESEVFEGFGMISPDVGGHISDAVSEILEELDSEIDNVHAQNSITEADRTRILQKHEPAFKAAKDKLLEALRALDAGVAAKEAATLEQEVTEEHLSIKQTMSQIMNGDLVPIEDELGPQRMWLSPDSAIDDAAQESAHGKYNVPAWNYDEIRTALNTSTDSALLDSCREELHKRLKIYHRWVTKNNLVKANALATETKADIAVTQASAKAIDLSQRFFRVPLGKRNGKKGGWWYAHFDGERIARQMQVDKPMFSSWEETDPVLLVAGKDDMAMCKLALSETGLTTKRGAEILSRDFEAEWARHGGKPYFSNHGECEA